jgi:alanine racemase
MDCVIELNKINFFNNIDIINQITGIKISPVLKSNAYGHGIKEIISLLMQRTDIDSICVAYNSEAIQAKKLGWHKRIIIMSPVFSFTFEILFEYFLTSFTLLSYFLEEAKKHSYLIKVHIKLNCGMNRFGFSLDELPDLIAILLEHKKYIIVVGIATHFPRLNYIITDEIKLQINLFDTMKSQLEKAFGTDLMIHPFSSKGMNLINELYPHCNMVRIGGALYGLLNHEQRKLLTSKYDINSQLRQVMTLKTKIIDIRKIKKGEYIGYGSHHIAKEDKYIAIANFGYGYGYPASLTSAPINGLCNKFVISLCATIGMNALFFDISHLPTQPLCGDDIILTTETIIELQAAHLSHFYISGREYTFTAMLHESIERNIV